MPESSHLLLLIVPAPLPQICRGSTVRGAVSIAGRAGVAPHTANPAPYWAHRSQKRSRPSLFCGLLVWLRCPSQAQSQTARPRLRSAPLPRRWARVRTSTPSPKLLRSGRAKHTTFREFSGVVWDRHRERRTSLGLDQAGKGRGKVSWEQNFGKRKERWF